MITVSNHRPPCTQDEKKSNVFRTVSRPYAHHSPR